MSPREQGASHECSACGGTGESRFDAYYKALAADKAYHAELVRVYGESKAGDARYRKNHSDPGVLAAYKAKREADDVWRAYMIQGRV